MDIDQSSSGRTVKTLTGYQALIPDAVKPAHEWAGFTASWIKHLFT